MVLKLQKYPEAALVIARSEYKEDQTKKLKYFKKGELFKKHPYIEVLPGVSLQPYNNLDVHGEYEIVEYCYPGAEIKSQALLTLVIDNKAIPVDILYFEYEGANKAMAFDITEHMKWIEDRSKKIGLESF